MPSDIFLTILRLADNCDELKSTKEMVSREIQSLVGYIFLYCLMGIRHI